MIGVKFITETIIGLVTYWLREVRITHGRDYTKVA